MEFSSLFLPVCSPQEMRRVESLSLSMGAQEEAFQEEVGRKVALHLASPKTKRVGLLVGPGNNGSDALVVGIYLAKQGKEVWAICLPSRESALRKRWEERFLEAGGRICSKMEEADLLVDGLFGTGFRGALEGEAADWVGEALRMRCPVVALDIPSGVDGTTGEVRGVAIVASHTFVLGAYAMGLFLQKGPLYTGKLTYIDFGLDKSLFREENLYARVVQEGALPHLLPPIQRTRHKYEAGYVVGYGGSSLFPGAAKLSMRAALRTGAGIVRLFHDGEIGELFAEAIAEKWTLRHWKEEVKRASALFVGSGCTKSQRKRIQKVLRTQVPVVVDAEGLQPKMVYPKGAILTPHRGEAKRLLALSSACAEGELFAKCQRFVQQQDLVVVLKGAPTWIFLPGEIPVIVERGDPGMATAGSGDVLTGMIAAFLAQGKDARLSAILGVYCHALAGEIAAKCHSSYAMLASDIVESISELFLQILAGNSISEYTPNK